MSKHRITYGSETDKADLAAILTRSLIAPVLQESCTKCFAVPGQYCIPLDRSECNKYFVHRERFLDFCDKNGIQDI